MKAIILKFAVITSLTFSGLYQPYNSYMVRRHIGKDDEREKIIVTLNVPTNHLTINYQVNLVL